MVRTALVVLTAQNVCDLLIHSKPCPSSFRSSLCASDMLLVTFVLDQGPEVAFGAED